MKPYKGVTVDFLDSVVQSHAFFTKALQMAEKGDLEMLPISILQCQNAEKAYLNVLQKNRTEKLRYDKIDANHPENIAAEAHRQLLLNLLEDIKKDHP